MRIQHNIMAMNAYRNYTSNVSAMKSNLEKLSSGYKINRAGDDAAGLAISEKMRAQITGLQTAQKNAKDGISLVQTAEGALTEVHDMLNRMVELATQSANGTYDNETDRAQMQKEVNQLLSEINRIADSSNFNGIKLLDGSMAVTEAVAGGSTTKAVTVDGMDRILQSVISKGEKAWEVAGNKTILDGKGATPTKAKFEVDLKTLDFSVSGGASTAAVPSTTTFVAASGVGTVTVQVPKTGGGNNAVQLTIDVNATTGAVTTSGTTAGFTVTVPGGALSFNASNVATVAITIASTATAANSATYKVKVRKEVTPAVPAQAAGVGTTTSKISIKIGDKEITTGNISITASIASTTDEATKNTKIANLVAKSLLEAAAATTAGGNPVAGATSAQVEINGVKWTMKLASASGTKLEFEQVELPKTTAEAQGNFDVSIKLQDSSVNEADKNTLKIELVNPETQTSASQVTLDMSASIKPGTFVFTPGVAKEDANKADTIFRIDESDIVDGAQIAIGDRTVVLKVGDSKVDTDDYASTVVYATLDAGVDLNTALGKISNAIGSTFNMKIVGKGSDGKDKEFSVQFEIGVSDSKQGFPAGLAIQRIKTAEADKAAGVKDDEENALAFDSLEKLAANFKLQKNETIVTEAKEAGKGLTLQIGDTPDSFNKLVVSIGDMHAKSLGIDGINIATQEGAADAMDKIKAAINQVSDVRGDLGATQNRLDHTINNLSVMTENIQDAESTIRDVDVADEMMAYTKNNILIQSAQAMLAQANQVPQGVLQLLQ